MKRYSFYTVIELLLITIKIAVSFFAGLFGEFVFIIIDIIIFLLYNMMKIHNVIVTKKIYIFIVWYYSGGIYMIKYNKLVRDLIPEIIEKSGKKCIVEVMDKDTYIEYLDKKLSEELNEYQEDKSLEELADLLEVVYAVTVARGYSVDELEKLRAKKAEERGGFEKRLLLKGVIEDESNNV